VKSRLRLTALCWLLGLSSAAALLTGLWIEHARLAQSA